MIFKGIFKAAQNLRVCRRMRETGEMGREFDPSRKMKYFFCISI
jgi:hypothetical protein